MTRSEMLEIHDRLKENKFRENLELNIKYANGYCTQMKKLLQSFWEVVKQTQKEDSENPLAKISWNFYHDYMATIVTISNYSNCITDDNFYERIKKYTNISRSKKEDIEIITEEFEEMEIYFQYLHRYLETGFMDHLAYWYRGVLVEYAYDFETNEYIPNEVLKYKDEDTKKYYTNAKLREVFPQLERKEEKEL